MRSLDTRPVRGALARCAGLPRLVTFLFLVPVCLACLPCAALRGADRPGVVLILTDDQGYGDLGVTGNPLIRTPHIDAMSRRSASMAQFYVSPVCAPTRASLMTGRYNYRTRVVDTFVGRAMMEPSEVTLAEILSTAGYATGIFGKWHLGDCYPMRPQDQGFQTALVLRGGGIGQPSDPPGGEGKYTDPILFRNGRAESMKGYCTDIYFREAMAFIEKAHREERPFFAYVPTNCPHGPFHDVPEAEYETYRAMDLANSRFPQEKGHRLPQKSSGDQRARIFAMITNIDENVGRLFQKLDALGITRDTIVIFMVDNGPNENRYVAGMKGWKSHVHEGGVRSPLLVHWPARLQAGASSDRIAAHIDLLPTLLDACGVEKPAGVRLDGRSLLPLLEGKKDVDWPDRAISIQSHRGDTPVRYHHFMTRTQKWKLVHPSGFGRERFEGEPRFELYDMESDPLEMVDVAAKHPDVVERMRGEYDRWFDDVSSERADNYAPPRIHVGSPHEDPVTLTRQDWRHAEGQPWGAGSVGRWMLRVDRAGGYELTCRFAAAKAGESLRVRMEGWRSSEDRDLPEGEREEVVRGLRLTPGDTWLEVTLETPSSRRGAHQVDVRRIES